MSRRSHEASATSAQHHSAKLQPSQEAPAPARVALTTLHAKAPAALHSATPADLRHLLAPLIMGISSLVLPETASGHIRPSFPGLVRKPPCMIWEIQVSCGQLAASQLAKQSMLGQQQEQDGGCQLGRWSTGAMEAKRP